MTISMNMFNEMMVRIASGNSWRGDPGGSVVSALAPFERSLPEFVADGQWLRYRDMIEKVCAEKCFDAARQLYMKVCPDWRCEMIMTSTTTALELHPPQGKPPIRATATTPERALALALMNIFKDEISAF